MSLYSCITQLNSHKNRIFVADEYVKAKFNEQNDIPYLATFFYIHRHLNEQRYRYPIQGENNSRQKGLKIIISNYYGCQRVKLLRGINVSPRLAGWTFLRLRRE